MAIITKLKQRKTQLENLLNKFGNVRSLARRYAYELTVIEGKIEQLIIDTRKLADKFVFSLTNVCHALKISKELVQFVWENGKDATVQLVNGSMIELPRYNAIKAMGEMRKARSLTLTVTRDLFDGSKFTVRNETSDSLYNLECKDDYIQCECQDYQNLVNKFHTNKVSCKHCYGVLNELGYGTLQDYVKDIKRVRVAAKIQDVDRFIPRSDSYSSIQNEARMDY